jgi:hypothetical protein
LTYLTSTFHSLSRQAVTLKSNGEQGLFRDGEGRPEMTVWAWSMDVACQDRMSAINAITPECSTMSSHNHVTLLIQNLLDTPLHVYNHSKFIR